MARFAITVIRQYFLTPVILLLSTPLLIFPLSNIEFYRYRSVVPLVISRTFNTQVVPSAYYSSSSSVATFFYNSVIPFIVDIDRLLYKRVEVVQAYSGSKEFILYAIFQSSSIYRYKRNVVLSSFYRVLLKLRRVFRSGFLLSNILDNSNYFTIFVRFPEDFTNLPFKQTKFSDLANVVFLIVRILLLK